MIELNLNRKHYSEYSIIGEISYYDSIIGYSLEDFSSAVYDGSYLLMNDYYAVLNKHVPVLHCVVKYDVIPLYDEKEKYDIRGGIIVGTDCDVPNWKVYNSEFVISTIKNLCNTDDCVLKIRGDIEHKIEPSFWDVPLKNT